MRRLAAFVMFASMAACAGAVDEMYAEFGKGNYVDMWRVGVQWNWDRKWSCGENCLVSGYWEAAGGKFHSEQPDANNQIVVDIGVTPVFRVARRETAGLTPFLEGGILGLHLISRTYANNNLKFGSSFQFGHFLGFGAEFGARREFALSYRFQHMSNAGIVRPNQGINFSEFHLAYSF